MTMESKRAVIYARYSSSRQREESIERQIEICNDYAVAHNMLVIGSYVDRKKTGKTDTRPDFQRMIYESSKHLFDVVLVWRYDRFARNLDDHGAYERLLHKNSVDLISATEEIPEGSHSAIIKAVILGGNESYSVELAAKVSDGMHRAAMQGQTSGGPRVFGYRVVDPSFQDYSVKSMLGRRSRSCSCSRCCCSARSRRASVRCCCTSRECSAILRQSRSS